MAQQRMRTHTDYDYQRLLELKRVVGRALAPKETLRRRAANLGLGLFSLVVAGVLVIFEKHWAFVVVLALVGLYFLLWGMFHYQLAALATLRALTPRTDNCDYIFEKNYLLATNSKDGTQYRYETCRRLLETEGNLYFLMEGGNGLVLDKANVKGGTVDQLRAWLEEKSGKKAEWMGRSKNR